MWNNARLLQRGSASAHAMSPTLLLILYCIVIAGFSLLGGLLPSLLKMTHTRTQLAMSFVAGLMLGVAFYHLLPHSAALLQGGHALDITVWWAMIGLIVMLLLLRVFHYHQHDFSAQEQAQQRRRPTLRRVRPQVQHGEQLALGLTELVQALADAACGVSQREAGDERSDEEPLHRKNREDAS